MKISQAAGVGIGLLSALIIGIIVVFSARGGGDKSTPSTDAEEAAPRSNVVGYAPESGDSTLDPVTDEEASRRATSHLETSQTTSSEVYISPPVIEESKPIGDPNDKLGQALFADVTDEAPTEIDDVKSLDFEVTTTTTTSNEGQVETNTNQRNLLDYIDQVPTRRDTGKPNSNPMAIIEDTKENDKKVIVDPQNSGL